MRLKLILLLLVTFLSNAWAETPDLKTLKTVGQILSSQVAEHKVDIGWVQPTKLMSELSVFDNMVNRMMATLCSDETNKSILIVGEPSNTYKYLFARLATMTPEEGCQALSHVNVDASKLQGFKFVGTTEKLWQDNIEKTSYGKDVVLYFQNLSLLVGLGSHSGNATGIESTYVQAISTGKLKSVAFINKFDYQEMAQGRNSYVVNAFKETIQIDPITSAQMNTMVNKHLDLFASHLSFNAKVSKYFTRNIQYYQPNLLEPQRSMNLIKAIIRVNGEVRKSVTSTIKTPNPYNPGMNKEYMIDIPEASTLQIVFDYFNTEVNRDYLHVYDANTNTLLESLSGSSTLKTLKYKTNKLRLVFTSDTSYQFEGMKIKKVLISLKVKKDLSFEDIRSAIMKTIQIPRWIIEKDYGIIKELPAKLDGDVVGVVQGKKAVLRAMKVGYVSGRTDEKPAGSMLFVGPTGTGKSYIAKKAAEFMDMKIITMDMTQYASPASFDRFIDVLARQLVLYPFAIYLFEEIDKANVRVLDRLYFMMDEGIFYDKTQRPLFARGALIMMTTNAGHKLIVDEKDNPNLKTLVHHELQRYYRPSFLNRFDSIPIFFPFTSAEFKKLATIMTSKKVKLMNEHFDWTVKIDDNTISFMAVNGGSELYGARPMERIVENVISIGISEYQIEKAVIPFGATVNISKVNRDMSNTSFIITVNGDARNAVSFDVDLDINSGKSLVNPWIDPKIRKIFVNNRMFN